MKTITVPPFLIDIPKELILLAIIIGHNDKF